jgi:hypothetical protein
MNETVDAMLNTETVATAAAIAAALIDEAIAL